MPVFKGILSAEHASVKILASVHIGPGTYPAEVKASGINQPIIGMIGRKTVSADDEFQHQR